LIALLDACSKDTINFYRQLFIINVSRAQKEHLQGVCNFVESSLFQHGILANKKFLYIKLELFRTLSFFQYRRNLKDDYFQTTSDCALCFFLKRIPIKDEKALFKSAQDDKEFP